MGYLVNDYCRFSRRNNPENNIQEQHTELLKGNSEAIGNHMLINKGDDDEMNIYGYKRANFKIFLTWFLIVVTLGVLRLIFHWIPHWYLFATSKMCKVTEAEKILIIEVFKGKHKTYHVKKLQVLTPEVAKTMKDDSVLDHRSDDDIAEKILSLSVHFEKGIFRSIDRLLMFKCKKITYIWDDNKQEFVKLRGLDQGVPSEIIHSFEGLSFTEQFTRKLVFGPNKIEVAEQTILALLFLEVLNPFYIFQLLSFILWFCDSYYYYACAILIMSFFGIVMTVRQTRKNQRNLKSTVHSSDVCTILRKIPKMEGAGAGDTCYKSEVISTEYLVPGDVLEIPSHGCIMHCDAVLLTGTCILNESMLTGESVPVTKTAFPNTPDIIYDPKEHARHTLFCGTHIIQTRYFGNEKVLAVVVRTGFSTAKGSLVRSILYPPPVDFRFEKDSYYFVMILGCIALLGFIYTIVNKAQKMIPAKDIVVQSLDLITIVVPPALPAAMTVGRFYAQIRLRKKNIFCMSPRAINVSGSINCVCFDKTGTLTEDGLDLLCVAPIENSKFLEPCKNVEALPYNTFVSGLVCCHSLTIIDKQIVGDPLDLKMFESTKWVMEEYEVADNNKFDMIFPTVLKPPKERFRDNQSEYEDSQIGIIREFPFSSSSQRMGVIIRKLGGSHFEFYCKGSPEIILTLVTPETVPNDFHVILERYTREGYRVIALAHRELRMSYTRVQKVTREAIEKDMRLLGLIVLENRLKEDTTECIGVLNQASIRVIMVTGDNILTALSVAKDCGIVRPHQSIITINSDSSSPPQLYYTLTTTTDVPHDSSLLSESVSVRSLDTAETQLPSGSVRDPERGIPYPQGVCNDYRFAMTGKSWGVIREHHSHLLARVVTRGNIYARMSPEQKQQLVEELQNLGYYVSMCGDGANDCGALKAAHTGVSLSEAESSVASPFTSKNPTIACVIDVIKEGRAALVTSFGIFKYMAAYSLCQFLSVMILYSVECNLTDMEFLYIDLFIISIFAFFFGKNEAYKGKLVKEPPLTSLINLTPVLSLIAQVVLIVFFQVLAWQHMKLEPWYVPREGDPEDLSSTENYTIFTISSFQYIILALVFSKGKPYRSSIFRNYGFVLTAISLTSFSVYLALYPTKFLQDFFLLKMPDSFNFRLYLLLYALINSIASFLIEHYVIDKLVFKILRYKFHNIDKSKRKYLALERDLENDTKWPVLTSDFKSAASPQNIEPTCTAEFVIERENKFDKNHVLNKLYESCQTGTSFEFTEVPRSFSLDLGDLERCNVERSDDKNNFGQSIPNVSYSSPLRKFILAGHHHLNVESIPEANGLESNGNESSNTDTNTNTDEVQFSSFPVDDNNDVTLNNSSPTDLLYRSVKSQNTSYDIANSHFDIEDLPYDDASVSNVCSSSPKVVFNSFPNTPVHYDKNLKVQVNFNSLERRREKPRNSDVVKTLGIDSFENR